MAAAALFVVACGRAPIRTGITPDTGPAASGGTDATAVPDTGPAATGGTDATAARPAGQAYEPCGYPIACAVDSEPRWFGMTCVCTPRCYSSYAHVDGGSSCPASPDGVSPPSCDDGSGCEIPCRKFGEAAGCPDGLVCGMDSFNGLRCITTAAVVADFAGPDPRKTISDFELYGACRTYETPRCPENAMGTSAAFTNSAECFCSARCLEDGDCPVPPAGYGRALCMHEDSSLTSAYPGYCALVCADATGTFPCPMGLNCKAPPPDSCTGFFYRPSSDVSVCRGGYYRHGDGDDVIEPGELYGIMRTETPVCDPNLGQTSRGRCVDSFDCCVDADCPAPPPAYGSPFCAWDGECYLPCVSDADCPTSGYQCTEVDVGTFGTDVSPGCD